MNAEFLQSFLQAVPCSHSCSPRKRSAWLRTCGASRSFPSSARHRSLPASPQASSATTSTSHGPDAHGRRRSGRRAATGLLRGAFLSLFLSHSCDWCVEEARSDLTRAAPALLRFGACPVFSLTANKSAGNIGKLFPARGDQRVADWRLRRLSGILRQPIQGAGEQGRLHQCRLPRRAAPAGLAKRHRFLERH